MGIKSYGRKKGLMGTNGGGSIQKIRGQNPKKNLQ